MSILGNPITLGGGGADLNIDFGSTPPADTSKLWVPLTQKPIAVNITNNVNAIIDTAQIVFPGTPSQSAVSAFSLVDDKIVFSHKIGHVASNSVGYVSLADFSYSMYSSAYRTVLPMTKIKDKVYTTAFSDDVGSWSYIVYCAEVNLVPGSTVSFVRSSYASSPIVNISTPITVGNDMYWIGGTSSFDTAYYGTLFAKMSYGSTASTSIPTYPAGFSMCYPSTLSLYNNKIYFICKPSTDMTDYTYDLCVFDPATTKTTRLKSDVITIGGLQRDTIPFSIIDGIGYIVDIKGTLFKIDMSTYESTSIQNAFPFSGSNGNIFLGVSYNGSLFIREPKAVGSADIGPIYKLTPQIDVIAGTLQIIYDGHGEKWNALSGKDTQIKIDPIQIYLGNSAGKGEKKQGYLFDGSKWVSIENDSTYIDTMNALNIMGVN